MAKKFDLRECGDTLTQKIKSARWFPVDTGNLRDNATTGMMMPIASEEIYRIRFDSTVAPYVKYLEEGRTKVSVYDNPERAIIGFGTPFNMPIINITHSGKHRGFISDKTINYILEYICKKYDGEVR